MEEKHLIWVGMFVGGTFGGFVPDLWGAGMFSFSGILFSAAGAILGIWLGFRISRM